ncbi:MAG: nitroreductase [Phototrophicales bacterium]|nr:MAG: nitroreductase [Phototrophicales bacterium]RMG75247.1 MAG: nitroreductase family protein [Chloroflexota bacterium]
MTQHTSIIINAIMSRRSLRRYQNKPVPKDIIKRILQAGIWAPSAHNRQPWRFVVIETQAVKEQLAHAMGTRLRQDLAADHIPLDVIEADVGRSYERITSAPVLILVCLSMVDMDTYPDKKRTANEYIMAVQSVAMAGQNILLAAHSFELGACWMCAPLFAPDIVTTTLNLPSDWQPQGLITLGYPAQSRKKTRYELEKSVLWR